MRPSTLKDAAYYATKYDHGTRMHYLGGCRCVPCRAANSRYSCHRERQNRMGKTNRIVKAGRVRRHILRLSAAGIGRRTVAELSGVPQSTITGIKSGNRLHVRQATQRRIMAVDLKQPCKPGARVPAGATWRRINRLMAEGFSQAEIARRLGFKTPALQLNKNTVTAKNARLVARFYNAIMVC